MHKHPEYVKTLDLPYPHKMKANHYELHCGTCGRRVYVDAETYYSVAEASQYGFKSPFVCDECEDDRYNDFTYVSRRSMIF